MDKEATQRSSPQLINLPLLPKNCVALVGKTPVVLGKQFFVMDSKEKDMNKDSTKTQTQTGVTKPYTPKARKSIKGTTTSSPVNLSDVKTQSMVSYPSSITPGYEASYLMKALSSTSTMSSKEYKSSVTNTQPVGINTYPSDKTLSLHKAHVPKNFTFSLLKDKGSRSESTMASHKQPKKYILNKKAISTAESLSSQPEPITKPPKTFSTPFPKSGNATNLHSIEENLQSIPKEKPSGSITVNLNGQAVKIVGIPHNFSQSSFFKKQQKVSHTAQVQLKSLQSHSVYDKKIKAIRQANLVLKKSSSPATNRLQKPHGSATFISQLPPSTPNEPNKSMIIGKIASLTTQSPSKVLNLPQPVRAPNCGAINQGNITTVPRSVRPIFIPVTLSSVPRSATSILTPSSEPYSALKSFLKSSTFPITTRTSNANPLLQGSALPASQESSIGAALRDNKSSSHEGKDSNLPGTPEVPSQGFQYYTSLETFQEGKSVMVIKPVLDSSEDENDSVHTFPQNTQMKNLHTNSIVYSTTTPQKHTSFLNSNPQTVIKTVDVKNRPAFRPQIQSVFSQVPSPTEFIGKKTKETKDTTVKNAEEIEIIDVDEEEDNNNDDDEEDNDRKRQFNIHDKSWKGACSPSYVVLERLHPHNIDDTETGNDKVSVQCSPHCRQRSLAYLCNLNLMPCEKRPIVIDDFPDDKADQPHSIINDVKSNENHLSNKQEEGDRTKLTSSDNCIFSKAVCQNQDISKEPNSELLAMASDKNAEVKKKLDCELQTVVNDVIEDVCEESDQELITLTSDINAEVSKELDFELQAVSNEAKRNMKTNSEDNNKETKISLQSGSAFHTTNECKSQSPEDKQESTLSSKEVHSKINDKESTQLQQDLISLKRQVDKKRLEMQRQKKEHKKCVKPVGFKSKNVVTGTYRAASKQSGNKLPVVLGSLLKPGSANLLHVNPVSPKTTTASTVNKESIRLRPSLSSSLISPTYVMDCPASTLFGNPGPQQATNTKSTSLITSVPLHSSNTSTPNKSGTKVPLSKVYSALKSLSAQIKSTGQKLNGTQFIMIENNKSSVLLKVRQEALLPENLNALHRAVLANSSCEQTLPPSSPQISTHKPSPTPTKTRSILPSVKPIDPPATKNISSTQPSSAEIKSVSSTSLLNIKSTPSSVSQRSQHKGKSLSVSSSSNLANILSQQIGRSNISSNTTVRGRKISIILAPKRSVSQPSQPLRPTPLTSSTCNDHQSALTHVPTNSKLLPERKKRPQDTLSAEQRAAKRRRLEEKYPLPPGVIIKSEPDTSEYDIGNNWSVTSEIHTGFFNSSDIAESTTRDDTSEIMTDRTLVMPQREKPQSENVDTESVEMAEEFNDSPPPLDTVSNSNTMEIGSENCPEVIEGDTPPLLQPMPSTLRSVNLVGKESANLRGMSTEPRQGKSSTKAVEVAQTKFYDSGYDTSVSASSSAESLAFGQTQILQPAQTAKSKIQHLKELLKQKELQVENMRKKRLEMPEVDLNSL